MSTSCRLAFGAIVACVALPGLSFGSVVYTDSTFGFTPWSTAFDLVVNTTGTVSDGGGPAQCASCGDPGQAMQTVFTASGAPEITADEYVGVLNSTFTYNPAAAGSALMSLSASADVSDSESNVGYSDDDQFAILIEQGGNYYFDQTFLTATGFNLVSLTNVTASSFWQINPATGAYTPTSHPNFAGTTMEFGLYMLGGTIFAPATTDTLIYDNLSLTLTSVPEPASLLLVGGALAGLAFLRGKRRQKPS